MTNPLTFTTKTYSMYCTTALSSNFNFSMPQKRNHRWKIFSSSYTSLIAEIEGKECPIVELFVWILEYLEEEAAGAGEKRDKGKGSFNEPPVFAYVSLAIFNCE